MSRSIAFVLVPGFQLLDMAGPATVFQLAATLVQPGRPAYRIELVSERGGRIASTSGVEVVTRPWRGVRAGTVMVAGGAGAMQPGAATPALCRYLQAALAARRRVAGVCTGAFVLAQASVLNGRRATTHWRHAHALQRAHPDVAVDSDRIFVRDGNVWTSAGIAAGIDLALAMVEADLGSGVAAEVARDMVVYHRRMGGQSQFSALQDLTRQGDRMRKVLAYIGEHLTAELTIEHLAEVACLSPRQFIRAFKADTGQTPAKAVERIRTEAARALLEGSSGTIEAIARSAGFGDAERMRRAFVRVYGHPPQAIRRMAPRERA